MRRIGLAGLAVSVLVALAMPATAQAQDEGTCVPQPNGAVICSDLLNLDLGIGTEDGGLLNLDASLFPNEGDDLFNLNLSLVPSTCEPQPNGAMLCTSLGNLGIGFGEP